MKGSSQMNTTDEINPKLRPDYEAIAKFRRDIRSGERLKVHYVLERRLAHRLANAPQAERQHVYGEVYYELFESIKDHPQNTQDRINDLTHVEGELAGLRPYLRSQDVYLEIGCGDAGTSFAVASMVATSIGLDVNDSLVDMTAAPQNFRFLKSDGIRIDLPDASVDFVHSNNLMEHVHPEDAKLQLLEIARVLKAGGKYRCVTPSRLTGPHDISVYFDYEPTGFHLREYDYGSLHALLKSAGFSKISFAVGSRREFVIPFVLLRAMELCLYSLPKSLRAKLCRQGKIVNLAGLKAMATK
jgi:ubiquinone/menaquinone biosynthesis C-methylase UbiE